MGVYLTPMVAVIEVGKVVVPVRWMGVVAGLVANLHLHLSLAAGFAPASEWYGYTRMTQERVFTTLA